MCGSDSKVGQDKNAVLKCNSQQQKLLRMVVQWLIGGLANQLVQSHSRLVLRLAGFLRRVGFRGIHADHCNDTIAHLLADMCKNFRSKDTLSLSSLSLAGRNTLLHGESRLGRVENASHR